MFASFLNKAGQLLLTLWVLSLAVFSMSRISPGDPLRSFYGEAVERMSAEQLAAAREKLGLDDSLLTQYISWIRNVVQGDFGMSFKYKQPAVEVIQSVAGNTAALALLSFALIFVFSLLLAVFCVRKEGSVLDRFICRAGVAIAGIPEFFAGILLISLFSVALGALPAGGAYSAGGGDFADRALHLVLPLSTIVLTHTWYCAYLIRNKLSAELSRDYVMLLRAKGLSQEAIIRRHCLRNSLPAIISVMAVFFPHLISGTYVVEMIFSYPGMGMLAFESASYHDYNMLMLICLMTGAVIVPLNMAAQAVSERIDPRMRHEGGELYE